MRIRSNRNINLSPRIFGDIIIDGDLTANNYFGTNLTLTGKIIANAVQAALLQAAGLSINGDGQILGRLIVGNITIAGNDLTSLLNGLRTDLNTAAATLLTKLDTANVNNDFMTDIDFNVSADTASVVSTVSYKNPATLNTYSADKEIPLATTTNSGLMAKEDVAQIAANTQAIQTLQDGFARLKANDFGTATPAQQDLNDYAAVQGATLANGLGVRNLYDNHVWIYSTATNPAAWVDFGIDTVNQATNTSQGIVQGSTVNGKVYVENDGTLSVNGWDTTQTTLGNKANDSTVVHNTGDETIAGTKTFSTSPVVPSKTDAAANSGTAIATEAQVYLKANDADVVKNSGNQTINGNLTAAAFIGSGAQLTDLPPSGAALKTTLESPLINNTVYQLGNVNSLNLVYPSSYFIVVILFTAAASFEPSIPANTFWAGGNSPGQIDSGAKCRMIFERLDGGNVLATFTTFE
jgi:hypothetical protein